MYSTADMLTILLVSIGIAGFVSYQAYLRGKNPWLWFAIGFFFGILSPIFLLFFTAHPQAPASRESAKEFPSEEGFQEKQILQPPHFNDDKVLWYYLDNEHRQMGPVTLMTLKELIEKEVLHKKTYVWTQGMGNWKKIEELPELSVEL